MNNQQCMTHHTLINLNPNEYVELIHYYPLVVNSDRCVGSCNTLNDLSNTLCNLNKTEDLNLSVFNLITEINESKILTKYISSKCKCKFEGRKRNSNQKSNDDNFRCECKNSKEKNTFEKRFIQNHTSCICKNVEDLTCAIDHSLIMCD